MHIAVEQLIGLARTTDGFRTVPEELFDIETPGLQLLADGKKIKLTGVRHVDHQRWHAVEADFCPELAVRDTVLQRLVSFAASLLDFVMEETDNLSRVTAEWIRQNSFALPVLINATGTYSKRNFKSHLDLTGLSDRTLSVKDSERIARLFAHSDIEDRSKIESAMRPTCEGVLRNVLGKVLFESIVDHALTNAGLPYVREEENRVIEGAFSSGRADFAFPCPEAPKAFIEVRKSSASHASLYASDKSSTVISWKSRHPDLLGILIYAGPWTGPSLDQLRRLYDYVFHVSKANIAADLIKRHLDGDTTVLRRRIAIQVDCL